MGLVICCLLMGLGLMGMMICVDDGDLGFGIIFLIMIALLPILLRCLW